MNLFHKVRYFLLKKRNPIQYARKLGVTIGENCRLIGSPNWGSEPWLITLGNHTEVSCDCAFITHDGATWVFRNEEKYKNVVKFGKINIGNDCFIGARSTIMPGISIGDKAIVAACSLVNKSIPSGEIWGGVPAHFITTVDEYAEKCLQNTPEYDLENYKKNFKDEVLKMLQD